MSKYVLAIDIGTTSNKTVIFDLKGNVISESSEEFNLIFPQQGWVDQNANDWWEKTSITIKKAIEKAKSKIAISDIKSISVTNQRETIVPVDSSGIPLRNAIVWQDRRSIKECSKIKEIVGEEKIYNITGLTVDPYFSGPKILWIKENEPNLFNDTYKFLLVHDFIQFKLTGKFITDYSNASRTMLFDINSLNWSDKICNALRIPKEKLPQIFEPGQKIGTILSEIAEEFDLSNETLVIAGAGDQQCAALGVGVTKPGLVKITTGTGSFILTYLDKPMFDKKRRILCSSHAIPNKWVMEASIFNSGSVLKWFRDNFCQDLISKANEQNTDVYDLMTEIAKKTPLGADGLLLHPYFTGAGAPNWNPYARGIFSGLFLGHHRGHMIRSIYEGVAYEIRENLELMNINIGKRITEVRLTGGGAKSTFWNEIIANVNNVKIKKTKFSENTALGAAILAAYGAGLYSSIELAAQNMIQIVEKINPDISSYEEYTEYYQISREIYKIFAENKIFRRIQEKSDKLNSSK